MKTYGENVKMSEYSHGNFKKSYYVTIEPDGTITRVDLKYYPPTVPRYRAIIDYTAYKLDIPEVMADGREIHSIGHYTITDLGTGEVLERQKLPLEVKREATAIDHTRYLALEMAQKYGFKEREFNLFSPDNYAGLIK